MGALEFPAGETVTEDRFGCEGWLLIGDRAGD